MIMFFCLVAAAAWAQNGPVLRAEMAADGSVLISWPYPSTGYVLQMSPRVEPAQWRDVEAPPQAGDKFKMVTQYLQPTAVFFRLRPGCLDLSELKEGSYRNPLVQGNVTFTVLEASGGLAPSAEINMLGNYLGLDAGAMTQIDLPSPCLEVDVRLVSFAMPATVQVFNAKGVLVGSSTMSANNGVPEVVTVNAGGEEIHRVQVDAPQRETLILGFCCRDELRGNGEPHNPYGSVTDAPSWVNEAEIGKDGIVENFRLVRLSPESFSRDPKPPEKKDDDTDPKPPEKISPLLLEWLGSKDPGEVVDLLVTFQEDSLIPLLPELGPNEDREKGANRRGEAIQNLAKSRLASQNQLLLELRRIADAKVFEPQENFWLVNAVRLKADLGSARRMAQFGPVMYLQLVEGGEPPPADGNNDNDLIDGRSLVVSDPYFALGLTQPWIGLLDTGIRSTHVVFNSPRNVAWLRDCVNGGPNCNTTTNPGYDPSDFAWNHGTCSASILVGNNRLGAAWRGVTESRLDSWQIYTAAGLNGAAAVRAFQAAVAAFDKVLVGEIQANEAENGAIATAADNAYNAGAIIVAANGNFGPNASTVRSPGNAHKAIGVGGFMTDDGTQYGNQGRGPAADGRYKPDIQAPTWSETASASGDNAMKVFTGTSGATPYASAVAMLARNWLHRFGTYDNGQVYAFMILYGQRSWPYNNTEGAGRIRMAVNGHARWGKLVVVNGANINIGFNVTGGRNFDAALWWPETSAQSHNDIDVHLIDPSGVERARGYSGPSVFERARVAGTLPTGQWTLRIRGYSVPTGAQVVYWASHIEN